MADVEVLPQLAASFKSEHGVVIQAVVPEQDDASRLQHLKSHMSQTLHHLNQFLLALPITGCGGGSQCILIYIYVYIRHICNLFCNLEKKKKTPKQFRKPAVSLSAWLSLLSPCRCSAEPASSCQGGRPTGQR